MYSQANEEQVILDFFGEDKGRFLDIGAADGKTFSNTLALAERGWAGVCVEASPHHFIVLQKQHLDNPHVDVVCAAMGTKLGCLKFHDSKDVLGTLDEAHKSKWEGVAGYNPIYLSVTTPEYFFKSIPGPYNFVSIDIEGVTIPALRMFPSLKEMEVKLVCVEINDGTDLVQANMIMASQEYKLHVQAGENAFYVVA